MTWRQIQEMPDDFRTELEMAGLLDEYRERPFYQCNDYLSWIARAQRDEARRNRIAQMMDELDRGGVYMKMDHPPSANG
jgi:uncharacterized protein YdeI (YjbR/CyaY-like superfamily)